MTLILYGVDISHHQGSFDLGRTAREGFDFAIMKATEGNSFVDKQFASNLAKARNAGLIYAAYHYVRANSSAASQVRHIASVVPPSCPVILDVEHGGGNIALTRDLNQRLNAAGYRTPLLYLPKWYWEQIGRPNMSGLPPLWFSRYPANRAGTASAVWARNAGWLNSLWGGYGGLGVEILQYSDQGVVAGHSPVDLNAYRGTRSQLAALFGSGSGGAAPTPTTPTTTISEDDTMAVLPAGNKSATLGIPTGAKRVLVGIDWGKLDIHQLLFVGGNYPPGDRGAADFKPGFDKRVVDASRPWVIPVPAGAISMGLWYTSPDANHPGVTFLYS